MGHRCAKCGAAHAYYKLGTATKLCRPCLDSFIYLPQPCGRVWVTTPEYKIFNALIESDMTELADKLVEEWLDGIRMDDGSNSM